MQLDVLRQKEILDQAQKMTSPPREPVQLPHDHMRHIAAITSRQEFLQGRAFEVFPRPTFVDQDVALGVLWAIGENGGVTLLGDLDAGTFLLPSVPGLTSSFREFRSAGTRG